MDDKLLGSRPQLWQTKLPSVDYNYKVLYKTQVS